MYGATCYETASNLPASKCSGGWEFYKRIDLTTRGTLRFAVDPNTVRQQVKLRGWHVWDETPPDSRKGESASVRLPREQRQYPAERESFVLEGYAGYAGKERAPVSVSTAPRMELKEAAPRPATAVKPSIAETERRVSMPAASHQVVWFDIPVRDIDRAVRFYSAVLGMPLKKEQAGPGAAIAVLPHTEGAIGGSLVQNMDARPSESGPLLYLNTRGRLDEALNAVEKHGGKVLAERHSIAPFGFRAIVLDSEGNRIALHST
jgi:hypothetical protein